MDFTVKMVTDIEKKQEFILAVGDRVGLIMDDDYWDYWLKSHEDDYGYESKYKEFSTYIDKIWGGDVKKYRKEKYKIREIMLDLVHYFKREKFGIKRKDCNEVLKDFLINKALKGSLMHTGHYYLSIDMKEANFQTIDYLDLMKGKKIEDYIKENSDFPEIMDYKGNRLEIWDYMEEKMGASLLQKWELFCLSKIYESDHEIIKYIKDNNLNLCKINGDEMMFEIGKEMSLPQDFVDKWCKKDVDIEGLICHVRILQYGLAHYKINGQEQWKAYYDNYVTGQRRYNAKNCLYIHQLDKLYRGKKLTEKDKVIKNGTGFRDFIEKIEILKV